VAMNVVNDVEARNMLKNRPWIGGAPKEICPAGESENRQGNFGPIQVEKGSQFYDITKWYVSKKTVSKKPQNTPFLNKKYRNHLIYFLTESEKMVRKHPKKGLQTLAGAFLTQGNPAVCLENWLRRNSVVAKSQPFRRISS